MENQQPMDDKDRAISILVRQRNSLMDQLTQLQMTLEKVLEERPLPTEKKDDNVSN